MLRIIYLNLPLKEFITNLSFLSNPPRTKTRKMYNRKNIAPNKIKVKVDIATNCLKISKAAKGIADMAKIPTIFLLKGIIER